MRNGKPVAIKMQKSLQVQLTEGFGFYSISLCLHFDSSPSSTKKCAALGSVRLQNTGPQEQNRSTDRYQIHTA